MPMAIKYGLVIAIPVPAIAYTSTIKHVVIVYYVNVLYA